MEKDQAYDCAIVGGGLAGLCLAIQLADRGRTVIIFEKNAYPFNKVCGEYISMESWDFLCSLGLPLEKMNLPKIKKLGISAENGFMLNADLDMGGFGISRHTLDSELFKIAFSKGITVMQNCKVNNLTPGSISSINSSLGNFKAKVVCGAYGRYTPSFMQQSSNTRNHKTKGPNYIAVKYHIFTNFDDNRIELHNFKGGYCGISKVDGGKYCLCYLTTSDNLVKYSTIKLMEEQLLFKNPYLKTYFTEAEFVDPKPLVISNVQFNKKQSYDNGVFLAGDAAGSITPLCGNGMSMGMRASKLLANELNNYFAAKISMDVSIKNYHRAWTDAFSRRIKTGYYLQYLFGKNMATNLSLKTLDKFPRLMKKIISWTHGDVF